MTPLEFHALFAHLGMQLITGLIVFAGLSLTLAFLKARNESKYERGKFNG